MNNGIQKIIDALDKDDGVYKREQMDAALELKEEITPHLIDILKKILIDPDKYLEEDHFAHMYAVILLGHFREPKAHKAIADVFSLPNDLPHELFGDLTTAHLPAVLFLTCNGSLDVIKSLASNKEAYQFCRISALEALVYAVVAGIAPREEIMRFYAGLFTGAEAGRTHIFGAVSHLAFATCILKN